MYELFVLFSIVCSAGLLIAFSLGIAIGLLRIGLLIQRWKTGERSLPGLYRRLRHNQIRGPFWIGGLVAGSIAYVLHPNAREALSGRDLRAYADSVFMGQQVLAADGTVLDVAGWSGIHPDIVPVRLAVVAKFVEQRGFDTDFVGISWSGIGRAFWNLPLALFSDAQRQGGSGIAEQLATNLPGNPFEIDGSLPGRIRELAAGITIIVASDLTRNEILALYLAHVPLGGRIGYAHAARRDFGCALEDLSLAQIAYYAAIANNPGRANFRRGFQRAKRERDALLRAIGEHYPERWEEVKKALEEPLEQDCKSYSAPPTNYSARLLARSQLRNSHDLIVQTTLDPALQKQLQAVADEVPREVEHGRWGRYLGRSSKDRLQMGALAFRLSDGTVVAYVAGRSDRALYFDRVGLGFVDIASLYKPLVQAEVAEAFGLDADFDVAHLAVFANASCVEGDSVIYAGARSGPIAAAMTWSSPCLGYLLLAALPAHSEARLKASGLSIDPDVHSAVWGAGMQARPTHLASAFTAAVTGEYVTLRFDPAAPVAKRRIYSARTARAVQASLRDVCRLGTARAAAPYLTSETVLCKTGTASERDMTTTALFVVAFPERDLAVVTWMHHDDPRVPINTANAGDMLAAPTIRAITSD